MKAVVLKAIGELVVEQLPDPEPAPNEVIVKMEWGGICGSDLGYWRHGGSGTAVLAEPLILGHEVSGRVVAMGLNVHDIATGTPVAIHPATLVGNYEIPPHLVGRDNLWPEVRYFGSAAFLPHEQGGFSTYRAVARDRLRILPDNVTTRQGAIAEPLGVAFHALQRAGDVTGKRILVNGAGPIGALCVAAARHRGAAEIWCADVVAATLTIASRMGANHVVDISAGESLPIDVDVAIEASGATSAIGAVLRATARGGRVVQVGNLPAAAMPVDIGQLVTREIEYCGSYRFNDEITDAIESLAGGLDVEPMCTHTFSIDDAEEAFATAADRDRGASKVLLKLS